MRGLDKRQNKMPLLRFKRQSVVRDKSVLKKISKRKGRLDRRGKS
jgi:hypothetical protein